MKRVACLKLKKFWNSLTLKEKVGKGTDLIMQAFDITSAVWAILITSFLATSASYEILKGA